MTFFVIILITAIKERLLMNKHECDELNAAINQVSKLRDGFYLSSFFIQPHLFHITNPGPEGQLSKHSHPIFEISIILEGAHTYIINKKELTLTSGDLIMIPPRLKHSWKWHDEKTIIASSMCLISGKGVQPSRQNANLRNAIQKHQYNIRQFSSYEKCIRSIIDLLLKSIAFREDELCNLQKASYIYLLRALFPDLSDNEQPRKNVVYKDQDQLVDQIKYYIYDNLSRSVSLEELQKNLGYSKEHLNRIFKKHQNITIGQFIMERKMEQAAKRLATTHTDMKTIALELGFSDVNYFYTVFKKFIGKSPTEYRKLHQKT
jgi:AraC-like DNA-binding protein